MFITERIKDKKREDHSGGGILRTAIGWKGIVELKRRKESIMGDSDFVEKALTLANQQDN